MVGLFGHCNKELLKNLEVQAKSGAVVDMEERFCSVSLDIIGLAVFNYDFGSVTKESGHYLGRCITACKKPRIGVLLRPVLGFAVGRRVSSEAEKV